MLNKEDKQFIIEFVSGFVTQALDKGLGGLKAELQAEIRQNGVYIEAVHDDVRAIAEDVSEFNRRTDRIEADLALVKERTADLPVIRAAIKRHSRQLAALGAK